jgi:hypothetical protein
LLHGRLAPDARVELPVLSGSMRPLLPIGARLEIAGAGWHGREPGEIIVFRGAGTLTAHRLLLAAPLPGRPLLYQKGDALPSGAWIGAGRVVGVVTAVTAADGARLALDTPEARREGRVLARRYLRWDCRNRLLGRRIAAAPRDELILRRGGGAQGSLVTLDALAATPPGCRLVEEEGLATLIAPDGVVLHELDAVAVAVWKALDGRPLAAVAAELCAGFEVSPAVAAADLLAFVAELADRGLVTLSVPGE